MKNVIAVAFGECAHEAGVSNFLYLVEMTDWRSIFLESASETPEVGVVKRG